LLCFSRPAFSLTLSQLPFTGSSHPHGITLTATSLRGGEGQTEVDADDLITVRTGRLRRAIY
jgi:hypothetical protein